MLLVPSFLVFDLDGTLIDSRADLCNAVNATLLHFGQAPLPEQVISGYIGDGAAALVRRSLAHAHLVAALPVPHDDTFVAIALEWFLAWYKVHKLDFTYVYPGVQESLATMRETHPDLPMAVLTNKPVGPSRAICRHFGLDRYFFQIYGGDSFASKKPDPQGLLTLLAEVARRSGHPTAAKATVMIGDSHVDVETARSAGTRSLGCLFGLSPETVIEASPDMLVETAWEWPDVLGLQ